MTGRIGVLIVAVVGAALVLFGVQKCRDSRQAKATAAETRLTDAEAQLPAARDSVTRATPVAERADSALTGILRRPALPHPEIHTASSIRRPAAAPDSAGAIVPDTTQYVTLAAYQRLEQRYDSLSTAAANYQAASRQVIAAHVAYEAKLKNAFSAAKTVIANPAPSRRWGIGIHAGYGYALVESSTTHAAELKQGPQVGVSVQVRLF